MKRNNDYILRKIAKIPYLLPVGQTIADQRRGIRLNETGVYLWGLLKRERTLEELTGLCAEYYSVDNSRLPQLREDILQFITYLKNYNMLICSDTPCIEEPFYKCLEIAGLKCRLYGSPKAFPSEFDAFQCEDAPNPHLELEVVSGFPPASENGKLLLRNDELFIIECREKYILLFPHSPQILEAHLTKDGAFARFFCVPPFTASFHEGLFHAIRLVFLYLAQRNNMVVLHSASIAYRGRAWLFAASSGTGKSTHTNLWKSLLRTPVINGDLNLLTLEDGSPVIHGIPWCGTSGICDTHTYPLGGIILLKQAPGDYVEELSEDQKRLLVLQRLISPSWNKALQDRSLRVVDDMAEKILICRLFCTPHNSAVEAIKQYIDSYLDT